MTITVDELRELFLAAWGPDTCYPHMKDEWDPATPSRDQCGMTALVVQDILGGDLVLAEVHVDGAQIGHHYWNRLPDGSDVDLTGDQFRPEETVVGGQVVVRPPDAPRYHREQYELLRRRVLDSLPPDAVPGPEPADVTP
ncbi:MULTISPECIES: YunG family protein [unclassified Isoptericola]|uniref:YunG family protein n=1 Tax=unclassified Isoptericola TaxID=2623355 RepID=UPI00364F9A84